MHRRRSSAKGFKFASANTSFHPCPGCGDSPASGSWCECQAVSVGWVECEESRERRKGAKGGRKGGRGAGAKGREVKRGRRGGTGGRECFGDTDRVQLLLSLDAVTHQKRFPSHEDRPPRVPRRLHSQARRVGTGAPPWRVLSVQVCVPECGEAHQHCC